jgi:ligand-binding SRPBCC domain-containing protein
VTPQVEQVTRIAAAREEVWARAISEEGINYELRPWLRMTMPPALRGATIDDVRTGEVLGRSWILLGGLIPVDYDDLCLAELEPGRRFLERSSMLSMSAWEHERIVEAAGESSCVLTDRLSFELRRPLAGVPGSQRLAAAIIARLFAHRHRRVAAWAAGR